MIINCIQASKGQSRIKLLHKDAKIYNIVINQRRTWKGENWVQERTDKQTIFIWLLIFIMAAVLSACGKEEGEETSEKVFGIDYSEELEGLLPEQVICNQGNAWAITTVKGDFIYKLVSDSGAPGLEEIEWQPAEGEYFIINIAERNGTLYAEIYNKDEDMIEIRKYPAYGGWSDVMTAKPEGEGWYTMGSGFFADGSGNIYLVNGNIVTCFDGEGKQKYQYELSGTICFFQENGEGYTECVTADAKGITLYELGEDRAEEKWTWKVSEAVGQVHGIGSSEEGMLCLATDQELLFFERESGSLLARTELVKLGVASAMSGYYDAEEGTLRLYESVGNRGGLRYSLLSERDASDEQRTELVYGMVGRVNADTTASIWTAITAFNQENENYYVSIKNYDNNLDRLHSDMAAGNGPDIIDMTYSEYYESYVKNGYLEDLTPYLEQSQYKDDIIWNVLDAYRMDGGLYVFVPQFLLEGLLIHPEYESIVEEWNMETFHELIEKNQWEKDMFDSTGSPESLLRFLLYGRQEEFIDWERQRASFETEEFMDMLTLCREYSEADWSDAKEWTFEERGWNTLCKTAIYGGMFYTYLFNVDIYGREYPIYGYPTLSGQTYGVAACSDSCAIYSGSKQKEGAWEFIESLLSESNQKYSGIANPGFPVRKSVLEEMAAEAGSEQLRSGRELLTITESEILILEDIIYNGNLSRVSIDRDIWSVIYEETAPYFAGDKSAEDVAHIIQSRVQIILQE